MGLTFECNISWQNCAALYPAGTGSVPAGADFTNTSCVQDLRLSGSIGRCGWPGAPCSIFPDVENTPSNCAGGARGLCHNGVCAGAPGTICGGKSTIPNACSYGVGCAGDTGNTTGICGGEGAIIQANEHLVDNFDFGRDYCLSGNASALSSVYACTSGNLTISGIPASYSNSIDAGTGPELYISTSDSSSQTTEFVAPATTSTPSVTDSVPTRGTNLSAIIGGAVGGVVFLLIVLFILLWWKRSRKNKAAQRPPGFDIFGDSDTQLPTTQTRQSVSSGRQPPVTYAELPSEEHVETRSEYRQGVLPSLSGRMSSEMGEDGSNQSVLLSPHTTLTSSSKASFNKTSRSPSSNTLLFNPAVQATNFTNMQKALSPPLPLSSPPSSSTTNMSNNSNPPPAFHQPPADLIDPSRNSDAEARLLTLQNEVAAQLAELRARRGTNSGDVDEPPPQYDYA